VQIWLFALSKQVYFDVVQQAILLFVPQLIATLALLKQPKIKYKLIRTHIIPSNIVLSQLIKITFSLSLEVTDLGGC